MKFSLDEMLDPADGWPEVPKERRPKPLYHMGKFPEEARKSFEKKGWSLVDIRLMSSEDDGDRAELVKAILEGMRVGSIDYTDDLAKTVTLEAQVLGLGKGKQSESKKRGVTPGSALESVLDFGKNPENLGEENIVKFVEKKKRKPGRPRKKKNGG